MSVVISLFIIGLLPHTIAITDIFRIKLISRSCIIFVKRVVLQDIYGPQRNDLNGILN